MKKHLRRYAVGALAIGAVAGGAAVALPSTVAAAEWRPVTYGLSVTPASLLPGTVSSQEPVRVVATKLDADGRPVITVKTATDKTTAEAYVKAGQTADNAVGVQLDSVVTATGVPSGTDPSRAQQWDFAKIRVADAWRRSTGAGITVAVIDSGVDASHPDLAGQVLPGIDLVTGTTGVSTDPNGHGTHVAGTIAALTGNGIGVSAIAPDVKILPIRTLDAKGSGWTSDSATGIVYAADHGAGVINMSLGGTVRDGAVTNAVAYARSKGVVVVAAAGNEREKGSPVSYPAADPGVIAVAATDSADKVAYYSNAGGYVDVAAPGSNILSTVPNKGYAALYGTSMASPHVAAVAALVKAANPALTPDQVEAALEKSAVDLGRAGKDNDYGYGRIDALAAVTAAAPTTAPTKVPTTTPTKVPTTAPTKVPTTAPTPTKTTVSPTPAVTKPATPSPTVTKTPTAGPTKTPTPAPTKTTAGPTPTVTKPATPSPTVTKTPTPAPTKTTKTPTPAPKARSAIRVSVQAKITVTSPAAGTLKVTLTGAAGQVVQVQHYENRRWNLVTSYTATGRDFTLKGLVAGALYRAVVPTTAATAGLTSGSVRIS